MWKSRRSRSRILSTTSHGCRDSTPSSILRQAERNSEMSEALWTPSPERVIKANMTEFLRYVEERGGPPVPDYSADSYWQLHEWSVANPERFWSLAWRFCGLVGHRG